MDAAFFIAAARLTPVLRDERIRLEKRCFTECLFLVAILYIMHIKKIIWKDKINKIKLIIIIIK
jgi:hypothetical protein